LSNFFLLHKFRPPLLKYLKGEILSRALGFGIANCHFI
jgi:hypothetical protein